MVQGSTRGGHITLAAPAWTWVNTVILAATQFWLGAYFVNRDSLAIDAWLGWLFLILGCAGAAQAWELGTRRVELLPDGVVVVRGLRRRAIAWHDVGAIRLRRRRFLGDQVVVITPENGKPVDALLKGSWLDRGFEPDVALLVQRWHRHVGLPADR